MYLKVFWVALAVMWLVLPSWATEQRLADISFGSGAEEPDPLEPQIAAMLARTMVLFGTRRDLIVEIAMSENLMIGTLASRRSRNLLRVLSAIAPIAPSVALRIVFDPAISTDRAVVSIVAPQEVQSFCPWQIEVELEGWPGPVQFQAGIERQVAVAPDLDLRFRPNPDLLHHRSLMECADGFEMHGDLVLPESGNCSVFLIASNEPIPRLELPQIKLALLGYGKGTGAALLPTALSGSAICQVDLMRY